MTLLYHDTFWGGNSVPVISTIDHLVRPNIRALKPYRSARQDHVSGVLLDANENAFGSAVTRDGISLNRYPDPVQQKLRERLAQLNGVPPDSIFVGVGSDEVIDLLVRIFCEPGQSNVVIPEPTYGMYRVAAAVQDAEVRSCLLTEDYQLDVEAVRRCVDGNTRLVFVCTPNNPTANLIRWEAILALTEENAVVVVDEAYLDFAEAASLATSAASIPNLVVTRTLSKAWGLAAARCGYAVAHPSVIDWLMRVKPPYNMNTLTASVALEALANQDRMRASVERIVEERRWLKAELEKLLCVERVFPSDANFLLVRVSDANRIYAHLAAQGIIVRNRSTEPRCENGLRITVGTRPQNELLIAALRGVVQ